MGRRTTSPPTAWIWVRARAATSSLWRRARASTCSTTASTPTWRTAAGPTRCVTSGQPVTVALHNTWPEPTSIVFPGQKGVKANGNPAQPQFDGGGSLLSMVQVAAAQNGSVTYTFTAGSPGTYLYES